jgi:tape measure domain-containing protein
MKIKITANSAQARRELSKTKKSVKGVGASILSLKTALIGLGTGIVLKRIITTTATFENLRNRLKLVTKSQEELEARFRTLTSAAGETRTGLADTIDLFTKLRVSTEELGYADDRVLLVTKRLSKALQLQGADTATAQAVIRQFGQAMASGTVRGDEFRSIVEGIGGTLSIMARQTGISVGALRKLSLSGQLTADVMFEMFENATIIDEEFGKMDATINSLETAFSNAFDQAIIKLGDLTKITDTYKKSIEGLTFLLELFNADAKQLSTFFFFGVEQAKELGEATENIALNLKILEFQLNDLEEGFAGKITKLLTPEYYDELKLQIQLAIDQLERLTKATSEVSKAETTKEVKPVEFTKQIIALQRFVLTEKQLLVARYNDKTNLIRKFLKENENITVEQTETLNNLIITLQKKLEDDLLELRRDRIKKEAKLEWERLQQQKENYDKNLTLIKEKKFNELRLEELTNDQIKDLSKATGRELISELAKNNKQMFMINKALLIKEAIMNTAAGVTAALKLGPFGIPLAFGIGALGAVQVATIARQEYTGRRLGGPVQKDRPYMVGESGKEMFVPNQSGEIIPNNQLGKAVTVNFNINTVDARGFNELLVNSRGVIVNMINSAVNEKGRMAIV